MQSCVHVYWDGNRHRSIGSIKEITHKKPVTTISVHSQGCSTVKPLRERPQPEAWNSKYTRQKGGVKTNFIETTWGFQWKLHTYKIYMLWHKTSPSLLNAVHLNHPWTYLLVFSHFHASLLSHSNNFHSLYRSFIFTAEILLFTFQFSILNFSSFIQQFKTKTFILLSSIIPLTFLSFTRSLHPCILILNISF